MIDDNKPEDLDEVITVTMPRREYELLRMFLTNLNAANMAVRWAAVLIGGLAVIMGIIYSWCSVFGASNGQSGILPHSH